MDDLNQVKNAILASVSGWNDYLYRMMGQPFSFKLPLIRTASDIFKAVFEARDTDERIEVQIGFNAAMKETTAQVEYFTSADSEEPAIRCIPKVVVIDSWQPGYIFDCLGSILKGWMESVQQNNALLFEGGSSFQALVQKLKAQGDIPNPEAFIAFMSRKARLFPKAQYVPSVPACILSESTSVELTEGGAKFKALVGKLKAKGARNPAALAAWIGRKKLGKEAFQKKAQAGRKAKHEADAAERATAGEFVGDVRSDGFGDFRRLAGITSYVPLFKQESVESDTVEEYDGELEELTQLVTDVLEEYGITVMAESFDEFGEGAEVAGASLVDDDDRDVVEGLGNVIRSIAKGVGAVQGYRKGVKQRWKDFKQSVKSAFGAGHEKGFKKGHGVKDAPTEKSKPKGKDAPKHDNVVPFKRKGKPFQSLPVGTKNTRKDGHTYQKQADGTWKKIAKAG
jgi:hypothetical protein